MLKKEEQEEYERNFCRALLAGLYGVEPEQLTKEFVQKAKAEDKRKREEVAQEKGWRSISPEDADAYFAETDRKLKNLLKMK